MSGSSAAKEEAIRALVAAGWYPADRDDFASTSVEIVGSVLLDRPYRDAPVSPLFYEGKPQAFAFEKPLGNSADRRNHVRFFETLGEWTKARPVWLGSATFDRGVGVSHYTGEVTHHIAPDIDAERNLLIGDLAVARMLTEIYEVTGVGPTLFGKNGGGDPYYTDGEMSYRRLDRRRSACERRRRRCSPIRRRSPPRTRSSRAQEPLLDDASPSALRTTEASTTRRPQPNV